LHRIIPDRELKIDFLLKTIVIFPIGNTAMTTTEVGARVRAARIAQDLRQEQLAAAAGVGVRFLIELEAGKSTAQLGKTLKVLETLGCRVEITTPPSRPGDRT
jgi:y4mF family transcriptional regulator